MLSNGESFDVSIFVISTVGADKTNCLGHFAFKSCTELHAWALRILEFVRFSKFFNVAVRPKESAAYRTFGLELKDDFVPGFTLAVFFGGTCSDGVVLVKAGLEEEAE